MIRDRNIGIIAISIIFTVQGVMIWRSSWIELDEKKEEKNALSSDEITQRNVDIKEK